MQKIGQRKSLGHTACTFPSIIYIGSFASQESSPEESPGKSRRKKAFGIMKQNLPLLCLSIVLARAQDPRIRALPSDSVQLTPDDISDFSALDFGGEDIASLEGIDFPGCKVFPGDQDWPSETEWAQLNDTLDGALLQPKPPAAVCYSGPDFNPEQCQFLISNTSASHYWLDQPLTSLTEWPQGQTCMISSDPQGNCTRGGFPEYVVNVTNVKHIQAAVNFARNKQIRLVIK